MFELQKCHYYEGRAQHFCILWYVKTQRSQMQKKLYIFISHDVILKYILCKKYICHGVLKIANIFKKELK
jgi:hypothetical protein